MVETEVAVPTPEPDEADAPVREPTSRLALAVFVAAVVAGFVAIMHVARHQWFSLDEWDFLASRTAWNVGDLLRPHNDGHWSTLPILAYRLNWYLFGLRTYTPYLTLVVASHLSIAALLRVVMRRAGVGPWLSTGAAILFIFFGSGYEDISWAFQAGFNGSLAFGLTHLLLADHDGAIEPRDWLGLLAGLAGLMCSGLSVTMLAVVGLAVLLRRGWRIALFHVVPLTTIFVLWYLAIGRPQAQQRRFGGGFGEDVRFVSHGIVEGFKSLGYVSVGGFAIVIVLVAGFGVWLADSEHVRDRAKLAAPLALLVGAVVDLAVSAAGRSALGSAYAGQSRYLYIFAAMVLPAVALSATFIFRRSRWLGAVACIAVLAGLPGNARYLGQVEHRQAAAQTDYRELMLSLPAVPLAETSRPRLRPEPFTAFPVTIGWLVAGRNAGRVPSPQPFTEALRLRATLRLSLVQTSSALHECARLNGVSERTLDVGSRIGIRGGLVRVTLLAATGTSKPTTYSPSAPFGNTLVVTHGPLLVRIQADAPKKPVAICR